MTRFLWIYEGILYNAIKLETHDTFSMRIEKLRCYSCVRAILKYTDTS